MPDSMRDRMGKVVCDLIETDQNTALILADIGTSYFRMPLRSFPNEFSISASWNKPQ